MSGSAVLICSNRVNQKHRMHLLVARLDVGCAATLRKSEFTANQHKKVFWRRPAKRDLFTMV